MEQPSKIGRYDVVSEIGRGAMGVVYDAVDPILERVVAIKTINLALDPGEMEQYEKRFTVEARAAGSLNHPNIVTIYDIGRSGDLAYIAMEFLEGRELRQMIAANELSVERALDIAAQIADGLAYAHSYGIVHRDIKPANIMILRDDRVKITDFGVARVRSSEVRTQTGVVLGSPRYLSPEQVLGKSCDARADTFSLGVIIYETVAGRAPFKGNDLNSLMFQIVNFSPPPPSAVNPLLPPMLDLIVAKALAKNADDRYADVSELAADLRACRRQCAAASAALRTPAMQMVDEQSTAEQLMDVVPAIHDAEQDHILVNDSLPARGLAKEFDSTIATMRFAAKTGAVFAANAFAATDETSRQSADSSATDAAQAQRNGSDAVMPQAPPWSQRDRKIFLGAVAGAAVLGVAIVFI